MQCTDLGPICIVDGHLPFLLGDEAPVAHGQAQGPRGGQDGLHHHIRPNLPTHPLQLLQELHSVLCKEGRESMRFDVTTEFFHSNYSLNMAAITMDISMEKAKCPLWPTPGKKGLSPGSKGLSPGSKGTWNGGFLASKEIGQTTG